MPCVYRTNGVFTNKVKSLVLDAFLVSGHNGHGTVRPQISVKQLQESGFIAAPRPGGADQGARHLDPRPGAGDEADLGVFQQCHGLLVAWLVCQVSTRKHRRIEVRDQTRSRSSARIRSSTVPAPLVDAMIAAR